MKTKIKMKSIICTALSAAVIAASALTGCTEEHVHEVTQWKYTTGKESTCTTEGEQMGTCTICGDIVIRTAPVDPDNHNYGDWVIADYPTEDAEGKAVKTCSYNAAHTLEAALPKLTLSGDGYSYSQIITIPTAAADGRQYLELEHDEGTISFYAVLSKHLVESVDNVADAVALGSSMGAYVRSTYGTYKEGYNNLTNEGETLHDFSCEYGDDYTHIVDEGNDTEFWYSLDDEGNPFGVMSASGGTPQAVEDVTENNLKGYAYQSVDGITRYGAEDALSSVYASSQTSGSVLYEESFERDLTTNEMTARFSYSRYIAPRFYRYSVEFTLYPTGIIKSLRIDFKMFREYMIANDGDSPVFKEDGDIEFAEILDDDDNPTGEYYFEDHSEVVNRYIYYKLQTPKAEDDVVPENPYPSDMLYIKSFDVKRGGVTVGDGTVEITANQAATFTISNVLPDTADLIYDPLEIYLRIGTKDILVTEDVADNNKRLMGYFDAAKKTVTIKSETAGEMVIVLKPKGGKCEKVINVNVVRSAVPSSLTAQAYEAMILDGKEIYQWNTYAVSTDPAAQEKVSLYVGQPIKLSAAVPSEEESYVSLDYTAEPDLDENGNYVSCVTLTKGEGEIDGYTYYECTVSEAGEYTIWFTSDKSDKVYTKIVLDVQPVPSAQEILSGEYEAVVDDLKVDGEHYSSKAYVSVVITPGEDDWREGTIKVTVIDDVTEEERTVTYLSYVYSETTGLTTQLTGGATSDSFDYEFSINSDYRLIVTHTGKLNEKLVAVCSRPEEEEPETTE